MSSGDPFRERRRLPERSAAPRSDRPRAAVPAASGGVPDRDSLGARRQPIWLGVVTNVWVLGLGSLGVWVMFAIGRVDIAQGAFAMLGGLRDRESHGARGSVVLALPAVVGCRLFGGWRAHWMGDLAAARGVLRDDHTEPGRSHTARGAERRGRHQRRPRLCRSSSRGRPLQRADGVLSLVGGAPAVGCFSRSGESRPAGSATSFGAMRQTRGAGRKPRGRHHALPDHRLCLRMRFWRVAADRSWRSSSRTSFPGPLHRRLDQFHAVLFPRGLATRWLSPLGRRAPDCSL